MTRKAPDPHGLEAAALLLLPPEWWRAFSVFWHTVLHEGCCPTVWKDSKVAVVPKPQGGFRPIGLSAVCWRAGCRQVVRALRLLVESWLLPGDVGDLPGRGTADAHRLVVAALRTGTRTGVQTDPAKFFHSLSFELAQPVLAHFGLQHVWCDLWLTRMIARSFALWLRSLLTPLRWSSLLVRVAPLTTPSGSAAMQKLHVWWC